MVLLNKSTKSIPDLFGEKTCSAVFNTQTNRLTGTFYESVSSIVESFFGEKQTNLQQIYQWIARLMQFF